MTWTTRITPLDETLAMASQDSPSAQPVNFTVTEGHLQGWPGTPTEVREYPTQHTKRKNQTKRPPIRLGETHYFGGIRKEARDLFWDALVRIAPEIEESFKSNVIPRFTQLEYEILRDEVEAYEPETGAVSLFASLDAVPAFKPFTEATSMWARRFGLDTLWIKDEALERFLGLIAGRIKTSKTQGRRKIYVRVGGVDPSWTPGPFEWSPYIQSEAEFKASTLKRLAQELDEYISRMHRVFRDAGRPIPKPVELREPEHITWLVLYQVKGWSCGRTARDNHRERKTVEDGVKKFASLIGLPLRSPTKPGRPKGIKAHKTT